MISGDPFVKLSVDLGCDDRADLSDEVLHVFDGLWFHAIITVRSLYISHAS